jgi:pimeloyl-ACP methyl ester carboxylesterase
MEHMVVVAGSRTRYERAGTGPELVLLHGGGLDSARLTWSPVWPRLTAVADVVAPDLPGFGASELGATTPTLEGYRDWLVAFLDACGIGRPVLGGLSLGGGVALRTAIDLPDRVTGLVLCAPYGVDPRVPGGRLGWATVHLPGVDRLTWAALRHSRWTARRTLGSLLRRPGSITDELVGEVMELARQPDAGVAWRSFQRHEVRWSGPRTVFGQELAGIRCPALLLAGEHDLVSPARVQAAATAMPDARFTQVPAAGHWLPRDAPEVVAGQMVEFLTAAGQPRQRAGP